MPDALADSMFFGHRKGAFTGADGDHRGYFEQAHGGTLFLDEIGDMPPLIQGKILRVLEDGQVQSLGSHESRPVDVRVLAATNTDLQRAVDEGLFRNDLYYRLAQYTVKVPPLRERREDIAALAEHFLRMLAVEMGIEPPGMTAECHALLEGHPFPGNVRELKNIVERALIESGGTEIGQSHLRFIGEAAAEPPPAGGADIPDDLEEAMLFLVKRALAHSNGNVSAAAEQLGIHRSRVYRILARE
jgi:DNA-binding NtrC family response regulator